MAEAQAVLTFSDGSTKGVTETPEQVEVEIKAINARLPYIQVHEPDGTKLRVRVSYGRTVCLDVGGVDPTPPTARDMHPDYRDASRAQVADCPINLVNGVSHLQLVAVDEADHRFDLPCHDSDPIRGEEGERKSFQ